MRRGPGRSNFGGPAFVARRAGRFFSLLDDRLGLRTEGYSPALVGKIEYAGGQCPFDQAAEMLGRLSELSISGMHVQRITERLGRERAEERDRQVEQFQTGRLSAAHVEPPAVVAVHVDAGKTQVRCDGGGRGVHDPQWADTKVACFETYAPKLDDGDPQPEPPAAFLDRPTVMRLCQEIKQVRNDPSTRPTEKPPKAKEKAKEKKEKKEGRAEESAVEKVGRQTRRRRLLRTAVATMQSVIGFAAMVGAEAQRRGFYRATCGAFIGDGGNWIGPMGQELFPGWAQVLDFIHLLVHLYQAACAASAGRAERAWRLYERLLRAAWAGQAQTVLELLREQSERIGLPPAAARPDDPRKIVAGTLAYVGQNAGRMDYPRYRRLGLPVTSAAVESLVKQFNQRIKGSEKFWLQGGVEAVLQVRAAYLSEDGRADDFHARRPRGHAVGQHRLPAAA